MLWKIAIALIVSIYAVCLNFGGGYLLTVTVAFFDFGLAHWTAAAAPIKDISNHARSGTVRCDRGLFGLGVSAIVPSFAR